MKVSVLADGLALPQQTVVNGSIKLPRPASIIQAGLPIKAYVRTLPASTGQDTALGQGRVKNVNKAFGGVRAVCDLSFEVEEGVCVRLVAANELKCVALVRARVEARQSAQVVDQVAAGLGHGGADELLEEWVDQFVHGFHVGGHWAKRVLWRFKKRPWVRGPR